MTDETPKRGGWPKGKPRKAVSEDWPTTAPLQPVDNTDVQAVLFSDARKAFPGASVTLTDLPESHPKLAARQLPAQTLVRVVCPRFALAAMYPHHGSPAEVVARLRSDHERFERMMNQNFAASGG